MFFTLDQRKFALNLNIYFKLNQIMTDQFRTKPFIIVGVFLTFISYQLFKSVVLVLELLIGIKRAERHLLSLWFNPILINHACMHACMIKATKNKTEKNVIKTNKIEVEF